MRAGIKKKKKNRQGKAEKMHNNVSETGQEGNWIKHGKGTE